MAAAILLLFAHASGQETPACERLARAGAVFVGTAGEAVRRSIAPDPDSPPIPSLLVPFTVKRAFLGADHPVMNVMIEGPVSVPESGREYLVFGQMWGLKFDFISGADISPVESAEGDLKFLESLGSSTGATVRGILLVGSPHRGDDPDDPRRPLPHTTIRIHGDGFTTEAVTGADGEFVVTDVPEGWVRLQPVLPDHLTAMQPAVYARRGGCVRQFLIATVNGQVRGRVLRHDGRAFQWMVDLLPVDPRQRALSTGRISARADADGYYEFSALRPGAYLIGVNLLRPPAHGTPYKPTYYPGTTDIAAAVPVTVGEGTVSDAVDFTLVEQIKGGQLELHPQSPMAGERKVCLRELSNEYGRPGGVYPQFTLGEPVIIDILDGLKYRIAAYVDTPAGRAESDPLDVTGTAGRQILTLNANRLVPIHTAIPPCFGK